MVELTGPNTQSRSPKRSPKRNVLIGVAAVIVVAVVVIAGLAAMQPAGRGGTSESERSILDTIQDRGKLIIGTAAPFMPFEFYNSTTGLYEGLDIDIAQRIAQNLTTRFQKTISLEVRDATLGGISGGLETRQYDLGLSGLTITDARNSTMRFSTPYYVDDSGLGLMVKQSNTTISNWTTDLVGKKVIVCAGSTAEAWVAQNLVNTGKISGYGVGQTMSDCVARITSAYEDYDVFIVDRLTCEMYVELTAGNTGNSVPTKMVDVIPTSEAFGVAIKLDATELKVIVDEVINGMIVSGEMEQLFIKWGLS